MDKNAESNSSHQLTLCPFALVQGLKRVAFAKNTELGVSRRNKSFGLVQEWVFWGGGEGGDGDESGIG